MKKQINLAINILIGTSVLVFLILLLNYRDVMTVPSGIFLNHSRFLNLMDRGREYWDTYMSSENGNIDQYITIFKYGFYLIYVFILMIILGDKSLDKTTKRNIIILNILAIILAFIIKWFLFNNVCGFYLYMDLIQVILLSMPMVVTKIIIGNRSRIYKD